VKCQVSRELKYICLKKMQAKGYLMFYRHSNTFRKFELTPKGLIVIWVSSCSRTHVHTQCTLNHSSGKISLVLNHRSHLPFFLNTKSLAAWASVTWGDLFFGMRSHSSDYKQLLLQGHSNYKLNGPEEFQD
jgi:hypothetical protein